MDVRIIYKTINTPIKVQLSIFVDLSYIYVRQEHTNIPNCTLTCMFVLYNSDIPTRKLI